MKAIAAIAVLLLSGCTCSLIGADGGLIADLEVGSTPARYEIEAIAGTDSLSFELAISENAMSCAPACVVQGADYALRSNGFLNNTLEILVSNVAVSSGPAMVELRIKRDGVPAVDAILTPTYVVDEPNGSTCPPSVQQARVTIPVP